MDSKVAETYGDVSKVVLTVLKVSHRHCDVWYLQLVDGCGLYSHDIGCDSGSESEICDMTEFVKVNLKLLFVLRKCSHASQRLMYQTLNIHTKFISKGCHQ